MSDASGDETEDRAADHDGGTGEPADGDDHHHAAGVGSVGVGVVTVSSSRSLADDPSGDAAVALIEAAGHEVTHRTLVPDDFDSIQSTVGEVIDRDDVSLLVTTGGTGVTPDDVTPDAVEPMMNKALPGVGERFRRLSAEAVGARAQLSRATAGVVDGVTVCCFPGSENAVRLGVSDCVLPIAEHLVAHAGSDGES